MEPMATVEVRKDQITYQFPDERIELQNTGNVVGALKDFFAAFKSSADNARDELNGFFGYTSYEAVKYFEDIELQDRDNDDSEPIPDIHCSLYRYIIAINHFRNSRFVSNNDAHDAPYTLSPIPTTGILSPMRPLFSGILSFFRAVFKPRSERVAALPRVGGLHHRYEWQKAA